MAQGHDAPSRDVDVDVRPALLRLDLRLRLAVEESRQELAERAQDPFRGLYISDAEVDALLASAPSIEAARDLLLSPTEVMPRLARLAVIFELEPLEQEALLVCLAPEIDLRYERLYGYLQDDVTRRRPTVGFLLRLLRPTLEGQVAARGAFGPAGTLLREGLLVLADDTATTSPLLGRPLRLDERIAEYLLGSDVPDSRLADYGALHPFEGGMTERPLPATVDARLVDVLTADGTHADRSPMIYLQGPPGTAKLSTARAVCQAAGRAVLVVDLPALLTATRPAAGLTLAAHEALLQGAVLCVDGLDHVLSGDGETTLQKPLRRILRQRSAPTLLLGEARWEPASWLPRATALRVELTPPLLSERARVWKRWLDGRASPDAAVDLATRYRLDGEAIQAVAAAADARAAWRGDGPTGPEDIRMAARAIAAPPLEGMARRLEPRYGWRDLVLPPDGLAQLYELCTRARRQQLVLETWGFGQKHVRRAGLTALFAGPPGTGKTMAAEIVAGDLGLDLYRIDLSAVVSKYIGETEKNLERIFRAADQGDAVLLFDEADALFGKRSEVRDAHDRYANVEIAYLLQRLETYEGLAVLTTNMRGNLDEAFLRRLDCVLEFPLPEEAERLRIWQLAMPAEAPLAPDVDVAFMARKFKVAGGHIRNIAVAAAFLAADEGEAIGMRHLARAARREYQKLGKLVAESDFEHYFVLLKDAPTTASENGGVTLGHTQETAGPAKGSGVE